MQIASVWPEPYLATCASASSKLVDHAHGQDLLEELVAEVGGRRPERALGMSATVRGQPRSSTPFPAAIEREAREERGGLACVDEQALERVADAGADRLAVHDQRERQLDVGALVDVQMADALVVLDHRHPRVLGDEAHEPLASPRDHEIDETRRARAVARIASRSPGGDDLHRVGREPRFDRASRSERAERGVGLRGFRAAAQEHRVAALDAERRGVDRSRSGRAS